MNTEVKNTHHKKETIEKAYSLQTDESMHSRRVKFSMETTTNHISRDGGQPEGTYCL